MAALHKFPVAVAGDGSFENEDLQEFYVILDRLSVASGVTDCFSSLLG